jgi:hypothetical protein
LLPFLLPNVGGYSALMERDGQAAADARMWASVHFRSDVVAGQKIGEGVAEWVIAFAVPPPQR